MKAPKKVIQTAQPANTGPMFVSWADGKSIPANTFNSSFPIFRSEASIVRDSFSRRDYEAYRPNESASHNLNMNYAESRRNIAHCMWSYKNVGLLKNVVDLMADFACEGIEIVHPNRKIEKFLQYWGKKIRFQNRSERFLNLLVRAGNVVVHRSTAKLKQKDVDNLQRGVAQPDIEVETPPKIPKNEIPWGYVINSPLNIDLLGGEELAMFAGKSQYVLRIPQNIITKIKNPRNIEERLITENLPDYIIQAVKNGKKTVALDSSKLAVYHYKKDDWEAWGDPLASPILKNLVMLEKLQLADMAALDGAISHVRLWKLGSLEAKLYPTEAAMTRLADILSSAVGGGAIDIIWGPDLDIKETATDIYKFLGIEKYKPTLIAIYDGLGIPLALTGYASSGGLTNNFLSLRTLTKRLEYIRSILVEMWEKELSEIQQAFGFRLPASIRFKHMTLTDEAAEKALLVQLIDRNLLSAETIQERFGEIPELELLRQNREDRERAAGRRPKKAGQWFDAAHEEQLQKIALQSGQATPSEVGVNLKPRRPGEKTILEHQAEQTKLQVKARSQLANKNTKRGQVGQGRGKGQKDSQKRKPKNVGIQKARAEWSNNFLWAQSTQESLNQVINPIFLDYHGKKNMRSLSDEQAKEIENLKFNILCNFNLYEKVDEEKILGFIHREQPLTIPTELQKLYKLTINKFADKFSREPSVDELRQIQASVYALYKGEYNGEG